MAEHKELKVTQSIEDDADVRYPHTWEPGTYIPMKPFKSRKNLELNHAYCRGRSEERARLNAEIESLRAIVSTLHMRLTGKFSVPDDPNQVIDCRPPADA